MLEGPSIISFIYSDVVIVRFCSPSLFVFSSVLLSGEVREMCVCACILKIGFSLRKVGCW